MSGGSQARGTQLHKTKCSVTESVSLPSAMIFHRGYLAVSGDLASCHKGQCTNTKYRPISPTSPSPNPTQPNQIKTKPTKPAKNWLLGNIPQCKVKPWSSGFPPVTSSPSSSPSPHRLDTPIILDSRSGLHPPSSPASPLALRRACHCICDSLGTEEGPACPVLIIHAAQALDYLLYRPACTVGAGRGQELLQAAPWDLKGTTTLQTLAHKTLSFMTRGKGSGLTRKLRAGIIAQAPLFKVQTTGECLSSFSATLLKRNQHPLAPALKRTLRQTFPPFFWLSLFNSKMATKMLSRIVDFISLNRRVALKARKAMHPRAASIPTHSLPLYYTSQFGQGVVTFLPGHAVPRENKAAGLACFWRAL